MKLSSIRMKGFASFKDYCAIDIPLGIIGITGSVEDTVGNIVEGKKNGIGKTRIVESIRYALYGVGEYDRQEEIWTDTLTSKDEAFVKISFSLMGNDYTVERGRKSKSAYLDVFENEKRIGDSNDEAQAFIISLLGRDSKLFAASSFVAQKKLAAFIETDPAVRKEYVDSVINLTYWRNAAKLNKKNITTAENEQSILSTGVLGIESDINKTDIQIKQITQEIVELPALELRLKSVRNELDKIKNIDVTIRTLKEYNEFYAKLVKTKEDASTRLHDINNELQLADMEFSLVEKDCEYTKIFDVNKKKEELLQLSASKTELEDSLNSLITQERALYTSIINVEAQIKTEKASLLNLSEPVCNRCKQPITKEFVASYNADALNNIKVFEKQLLEFTDNKSIIDVKIDITKTTGTKVILDISQTESAITEYIRAQEEYDKAVELRARTVNRLNSEKKELNIKLQDVSKDIEEYLVKIKEVQAQIPAGNGVPRKKLEEDIVEIDKKIKDIHIKEGFLQKLAEDLENFNKNLGDYKKRLAVIEDKLYAIEVLGDAFKDIPTTLLKESIIEIEEYANEFIQDVLPNYKVKLYEDLEKQSRPLMVAFEVVGKNRNYKLLSGGQQSICAIGLRIGFNKVIARKARVSLDFLVLDEIFSALDEFNRAEVLRALISLNQLFPQILVITHTEEANLFPKTIHVRMNHLGESRIM